MKKLIPLLIISFLLINCSSTPSVNDGQDIVEELIAQQSKGIITLESFEKTNGQEGEMMGVETYLMEFQAQIGFNQNCYWGSPMGGFETITEKPRGLNMFLFQGKREAKAGSKATVAGTIGFEKTEQGWRGRVTSSRYVQSQ